MSGRGAREGLLVRKARKEDSRPVCAIYNAAVRKTTATFDTQARSVAEQRRLIAAHRAPHCFLVAELEGQIAGWGSLSAWSPRKAYRRTVENSVYVAESARGRGVGKALLDALLKEARRGGLHTILARVSQGNPVSMRLHERAGFRRVGVMREVGFKFGKRLDVELLQIIL